MDPDREHRTRFGAVDWLFRSRASGRIVVGQFPNVPLVAGVVTTGLSWVVDGDAGTVLQVVGTLSLGWWALDELLRGVNPFRRLLGAGALGWIVTRIPAAIG